MSVQLGSMHAASFATDPKHLAFVLARYHFVARMLIGADRVLEIGCGDGTGARIVRPAVCSLVGINSLDYLNVGSVPLDRHKWDIIKDGPFGDNWDAVYAIDVLEHIAPANEWKFFSNINRKLRKHGTVIVGLPSLESQVYASELSKRYHVNCKTEDGLRAILQCHYHNVYIFGMSDTTLHTGYGPMCQYMVWPLHRQAMKWVLAVPVWGDFYIKTFIELALPAYNAAMKCLPGAQFKFVIHTDAPFAIDTDCEVEFRPLAAGRVYGQYGLANLEALELADAGDAVCFVNADMVVSREFFAAANKQLLLGKQVILSACGRCRHEDADASIINLTSADLLNWTLDHQQAITKECWFGTGRMAVPWGLYFGDGDNVILRGFHLHPVVAVKRDGMSFEGVTVDQRLFPQVPLEQYHVVADLNEMSIAELTPDWRVFALRAKVVDAARVARWAREQFTYIHRWAFTHRIELRGSREQFHGDVAICDEILRNAGANNIGEYNG